MPTLLRRLSRSTAVHIGFAAVAMGGWTFCVNLGHGAASAGIAGLGQGLLSALITLVLKRALEAMAGRFGGPLAYLAPPACTATLIGLVLVAFHRLIHTPEILRTVALPWIVSTLYAVIYTAGLIRRPARSV